MFSNTRTADASKTKQIKNPINNVFPSLNMISEGTSIEGEINSDCDIRIDGTLKGVIRSKAKVVIGATGRVEGNIYCQSADILGNLSGTIDVEDILFLKNTAFIKGDIITGKLIVESGAVFEGNCKMKNAEEATKIRKEPKLNGVTKQEATV